MGALLLFKLFILQVLFEQIAQVFHRSDGKYAIPA